MPRIAPEAGSPYAYRGILARRPEVLEAWTALSSTLRFSGLLPDQLKEDVRRSTAERLGCEFCASIGEPPADPDRRTSLAIAVAQAIADDPDGVNERTFDVLREDFSDDEIVELIAFVCFICVGGQTFGNVMGVEAIADSERAAYRARRT